MKTWELETDTHGHIRIEWNESATVNLQTPVGGQWVDFHCFTHYGLTSDSEVLAAAIEVLGDLES